MAWHTVIKTALCYLLHSFSIPDPAAAALLF